MPELKKRSETASARKIKKAPNSITITKRREILKTLSELNDQDMLDILARIGVGNGNTEPRFFTCYMCGNVKKVEDFYKSSDPKCMTGITRICKSCASDIAHGVDSAGIEHGLTKQNLQSSLEYMDKPFIDNVFDSAVAKEETYRTKGQNIDYFKCYMQTINAVGAANKYSLMRWRDSDGMARSYISMDTGIPEQTIVDPDVDMSQEAKERYAINKRDAIKAAGYDIFASYPVEADKPRLYAQFVGFLDSESREDGMKLNAIIQICKSLNQADTLSDLVDKLLHDKDSLSNQAIINKMNDSRKKCMDIAINLARDNGISINYNNNKSAGQNTLSGKIKELTDRGLREAAINIFDVGTADGMRQVAEISEAARHRQIVMDENVEAEIKSIQDKLITDLTKQRDEAKERARILLVENKDLKEFLRESGLIDDQDIAIENRME